MDDALSTNTISRRKWFTRRGHGRPDDGADLVAGDGFLFQQGRGEPVEGVAVGGEQVAGDRGQFGGGQRAGTPGAEQYPVAGTAEVRGGHGGTVGPDRGDGGLAGLTASPARPEQPGHDHRDWLYSGARFAAGLDSAATLAPWSRACQAPRA